MELENQTIEQSQEPVNETVSNDEVQAQTEEWTPPQSKDELEQLTKAAINRAKTEILKELNVKSVKEFKEYQVNLENKFNEYNSVQKERDEYAGKYESLVNEHTTLKQERVLDKLSVQDEYRNDLTKLAMDQVSDTKDFETVLSEMVNGKYKYAVGKTSQIKMGIEKTGSDSNTQSVSPDLAKKYPWLKK
jgi:hypothetical protein